VNSPKSVPDIKAQLLVGSSPPGFYGDRFFFPCFQFYGGYQCEQGNLIGLQPCCDQRIPCRSLDVVVSRKSFARIPSWVRFLRKTFLPYSPNREGERLFPP